MLQVCVVLTCSCGDLLIFALSAGNQLSGTIPTFNAPYLKDLIIANNNLTGTVPSSIFTLPQVYRIDLVTFMNKVLPHHTVLLQHLFMVLQGGNQLTGRVPAPTATTSLRMLFLDYNELSGDLPVLTSAQQALVMDISHNKLAGSIPLFGLLAAGTDATEYAARYLSLDASSGSALDMDFSNNQLDGTLPSWLMSFPFEVGCKLRAECSNY